MKIWTKETILKSAQDFKNVSDWRRAFPSAYANAFRNGFLKEATSHMIRGKRPIEISDEAIILDAKKYNTKKDWIKNSRSKYFTALNRGILDIATSHMDKKYQKKTKEQIIDIAKNFKSKAEWIQKDPSSYVTAKKRGIFNEASSHMKRFGQTSLPEQKMLTEIKNVFPTAKPAWFENVDKESKFKRFQLDIYIPELSKAIEFNGTYWHSPEGLKRGRPGWTDEEILNYHNIKKSFFKKFGVDILDVDQKEWELNPKKILSQIFEFLKEERS